MAEANKSGILAKAQKRLSRTKTKVLQTLGKADRSTDETFDDLIQKTERQHDVAHNLQKEFKTYFHCMRALSHSSKSLAITLGQNYEEEWTDSYGFRASLTTQDLLWSDYLETVQTSVMEALNTYIASFPALKAKIAKRGRKMVDYDNSRHNLEVLQAAKKKDDAKIAKAQEDLNESKRIFEELHNELCSELPGFYNSRVTFYADLFQKHFGCENTLHTEIARISQSLTDTADQLSKEYVQFVYTPKRPLSKSPSDNSEEQHVNGESSPRGGTDSPASSASPAATPTTPSSVARPTDSAAAETAATAASVSASAAAADAEDDSDGADHLYGNQDSIMAAAKVNGDTDKPKEMNALSSDSRKESTDAAPVTNNVYEQPQGNGEEDSDDEDDMYQSPPSNKPAYEAPPNTLFRVEATHTYNGEDIDELTFEPGDIIYVVPFDNEEEQDDGWQLGIKEKDGMKGVFPENFTKRI
ncbi:hypothetical protein V1264_008290 [Littorina saxatilis]|uniref:Amphiphysin n=1 Tax=Littorina saxatilis TaxID=31220 RepID=A0AAN9ASU7_9CAEN